MDYHVAAGPEDRFIQNPKVVDLEDVIRAAARESPVVVNYYTGHGLIPEGDSFDVLTPASVQDLLHRTESRGHPELRCPDQRASDCRAAPGTGDPGLLLLRRRRRQTL